MRRVALLIVVLFSVASLGGECTGSTLVVSRDGGGGSGGAGGAMGTGGGTADGGKHPGDAGDGVAKDAAAHDAF